MPGSRLNDTERHLLRRWRNSHQARYPPLCGLAIRGEPGLRGIQNLDINFEYPLTVICGRNGCGKTTALALSALGFHSPSEHGPPNARNRSKSGQGRSYYTFSDFFFRGPGDPDISGVEITWKYQGAKDISIKKQTDKWMHYERRPERPVHYLGVVRSIPAIEQSALRSRFKAKYKDSSSQFLSGDYCARLTEIMGRTYEEAGVMSSDRYLMRQCVAGSSYSSFNMGAGEDILIDLLYMLQETPRGSMVVVEEIELGLHPEALTSLARHLQEIVLEKELQVVVSTHSQHFIDSVPREARVLIRRARNQHLVIPRPTTRFAIGNMSGTLDPELHVYCEDNFAMLLIEQALKGPARQRTHVVPVGSKSQLAQQGAFHLKAGFGQHMLVLWDGDVGPDEGRRMLDGVGLAKETLSSGAYRRVNWTFLPGSESPERWVVNTLDCEEGHRILSDELGESNAATNEILERLAALEDAHDIGYHLGKTCNITMDEALRSLIRAASRLSFEPLVPIADRVEAVLEGRQVCG